MLPKTEITISADGMTHRIEGMEKSDQCYKLEELAKMAGKVVSVDDKDHDPVHQDVNRKGD